MLPITGTIRSAVKLAELDNKWQQKKQKGGKAFEKDLDPQTRQIMQFQEDIKRMRENRDLSSITSKLKSGGGLTPDEIEYLQKNNPEMYREYMEIKNEKEAYERRLKSCRTKEDVEKLKITKMGSFMAEAKSVMNNPNIPEIKKLTLAEKILKKTMGIQKIHMDFVISNQYQELPDEEELIEIVKEKAEEREPEISEKEETGESQSHMSGETVESGQVTESGDTAESLQIAAAGEPEKQYSFEDALRELSNIIMSSRGRGSGLQYIKESIT